MAILVSLVFAGGIFLHRGVKTRILLLLVGATLTYISFAVVPDSTWNRLQSTYEEISGGNIGNRARIWRAGLSVFEEHPILGVGAGGYPAAMEEKLGIPKASHNAFLSTLVELGPIGAVLFLAVVISAFLSVLGMKATERWFWLVLLLMWFIGASFTTSEADKHTWLFLALAYSIGTRVAVEGRTLSVPTHRAGFAYSGGGTRADV